MNFCRNCGAELGVGRFCTNCGAQAATSGGAPTPNEQTAVRLPPVPPENPAEQTAIRMPAVPAVPSGGNAAETGPRYPLFADELPTRSPDGTSRVDAPARAGASHAATPPSHPSSMPASQPASHREARSSRAGWIVAAVLLLLLCGGGIAWWATSGDDDGDGDVAGQSSQGPSPDESAGSEGPSEDTSEDVETPPGPEDPPVDLAESASASGPAPVSPGQDFSGQTQRYPAANMLDGDPSTAYRMNGDRTDTTITFDLDEEATIREVGIVNGFAKTDTDPSGASVDWYSGNRRVLAVEWTFDDGTVVSQDLSETTDLQTIAVDGVTTESVELRLVEVSPPGSGKWGRDVTALGTVLLRGSVD